MIRAAIFDIDGTLVDSVDLHTQAWLETLRHFGVEVAYATMRHEIGKGADQLLPRFLETDALRARQEEMSEFRSALFKRDYLGKVRPFPGVPALFRRARESGLTLVLASSSTSEEVGTYAEIAGISDLVDVRISADDAERSKPDGDIFAAALARIAPIGPDEAVVVGDTPWDAIAAGKAGILSVGVLCGGVPAHDLREAGAVATFEDPADLLSRFDQSPLSRER